MTKRNLRKSAAQLGLLAVTAASLSLFGVASASAAEVAPAVISPTSGGSSQTFNLTVPNNSHCSKDTSTGHYVWTSYIVPASTDPGTLTWTAAVPNQGFQLYDTFGNPIGPNNTAIGSGNIQNPPPANFALFSVDGSGGNANMLPPGDYNVGLACVTNTNQTDVFWNVELTFTASNTDPNGETWAVSSGPALPESPFAIALPIGAVLILGLGLVIVVRRRHEDVPAAA